MTKILVVGALSPRQKKELNDRYPESEISIIEIEINPFWTSSTVIKDIDKTLKKANKLQFDVVFCNVNALFDFWFNTNVIKSYTTLVWNFNTSSFHSLVYHY